MFCLVCVQELSPDLSTVVVVVDVVIVVVVVVVVRRPQLRPQSHHQQHSIPYRLFAVVMLNGSPNIRDVFRSEKHEKTTE